MMQTKGDTGSVVQLVRKSKEKDRRATFFTLLHTTTVQVQRQKASTQSCSAVSRQASGPEWREATWAGVSRWAVRDSARTGGLLTYANTLKYRTTATVTHCGLTWMSPTSCHSHSSQSQRSLPRKAWNLESSLRYPVEQAPCLLQPAFLLQIPGNPMEVK